MREDQITSELSSLAFKFFYRFSRFEFCLKENNYLKNENVGSNAEPGWNKFISRHARSYQLSEEAISLLREPPDRQVVGQGSALVWEPLRFGDGDPDLKKVVKAVKTVRNNLFHGGKHSAAGWDDSERMHRLITCSVAVLDCLAEIGEFEGDYRKSY
ncbi:hypothetical protein ACKC9G_00585 [Pokkaliibacter sp. CJK22405]|uniref:hypothetical protein n=1 Tax=Pokkaliibacter sp. CJK22405 TaxID=3384615 RepID=UPI003984FF0F